MLFCLPVGMLITSIDIKAEVQINYVKARVMFQACKMKTTEKTLSRADFSYEH